MRNKGPSHENSFAPASISAVLISGVPRTRRETMPALPLEPRRRAVIGRIRPPLPTTGKSFVFDACLSALPPRRGWSTSANA